MTITARITKRVPTQGATESVLGALGGDTWGGAWGGCWGSLWSAATETTVGEAASPAVNVTPRLSVVPSAANTRRISPIGIPLALEGDESGVLLLEGDMTDGDDNISLEGDESVWTQVHTQRVAA